MFNKIPDILYDGKIVKNFFRKVRLRDDAFQFVTAFREYNIKDGETPEDVSFRFYKDIKYYWIILAINDIQNVETDWYMPTDVFEDYINEKYPDDGGTSTIHYVTNELKVNGTTVLEPGLIVDEDFEYTYKGITYTNLTSPKSFRDVEVGKNEAKRRISILKVNYLSQYEKEFKNLLKYDTSYGIVNGLRINNV